MKKIISISLAIFMILSLASLAFADTQKGSITINGISGEGTYKIYRMLDLSYDANNPSAYAYTVNSSWTGFFASDAAKAFITLNAQTHVAEWIGEQTDSRKVEFANLALKYAQDNDIAPIKTYTNNMAADATVVRDGTKLTFSDLELGYYLIDSTMGTLCGLTTTNYNASITAKNAAPTVDKQVKEDSTSQWTDTHNTADIGQTVEYRVTINVHSNISVAGAEKFVLHDVMETGLTFKEVTGIGYLVPGSDEVPVDAGNYTVATGTDGCSFEVRFSDNFCNDLDPNNKIIIYYTAMLNRNATIAGTGNENKAWMTYGEGHKTAEDKVVTYTYGIDLIKTDSANTLISGAQFKIYDAENGGNEVAVVPNHAVQYDPSIHSSYYTYFVMEGEEKVAKPLLFDFNSNGTLEEDEKIFSFEGYRRARADETGAEIIMIDGQMRLVGFDNGTYYMAETIAPDGFNKIPTRQKFIINDGNLDATFNGDIYSTGSGVQVVNNTGTMLPETGGLGTLLFTILGGGTAMGTGVVLVTKKRMSKIEDDE